MIQIKARPPEGWYAVRHRVLGRFGGQVMILDTNAYIALGFMVGILLISGGLAWFVVSRLKR